jgi:hypothetical protein
MRVYVCVWRETVKGSGWSMGVRVRIREYASNNAPENEHFKYPPCYQRHTYAGIIYLLLTNLSSKNDLDKIGNPLSLSLDDHYVLVCSQA